MKLKKLIILTIFIIIITSLLTTLTIKSDTHNKVSGFMTYHLYDKYNIIKTQELNALIEISNTSGWNLETENLNFGRLQPGDSSARFINIHNNLHTDVIVKIQPTGQIKDWLSYPNNIFLSKDTEKEIEISVKAPINIEKGFYSGKVLIIYIKN